MCVLDFFPNSISYGVLANIGSRAVGRFRGRFRAGFQGGSGASSDQGVSGPSSGQGSKVLGRFWAGSRQGSKDVPGGFWGAQAGF